MATYWKGNVTATNGSKVVTKNSGDDVNTIAPQSFLQISDRQVVEVESVNTSNQTIVLARNYEQGTTTADAIVAPVSIAELRKTTAKVQTLIDATESVLNNVSFLPEADTIAKRTTAGRLKVGAAVEANEAVALSQFQGLADDVNQQVDEKIVEFEDKIDALGLALPIGVEWNPVDDTYARPYGIEGITDVHRNMRRCLLLDNGTVNYYLDPNDSAKKMNGDPAVLDGTDGQVMVEIPTTWVRYRELVGGVKPIQVRETSATPRSGFVVHPAFCIGGTLEEKGGMWQVSNPTRIRDYVYVGAYNACLYDASADAYVSGLNLDDMRPNTDLANDKLSSVSGVYPLGGLTRGECRQIAANRGTGWCQMPFWVNALLQWLFATEYNSFRSQQVLANGNVSVSSGYPSSSSDQLDSPHSLAGKSNLIGNGSGGVDSTVRDTAWMSYRGIENYWGNCYAWVDGVNINDQTHYVTNTIADFADATAANYTEIATAPDTSGYISDVAASTLSFIPTQVTGASSSRFADYYYAAAGWRVAAAGGSASNGATAGGFVWYASSSAALRNRSLGARLAYMGS